MFGLVQKHWTGPSHTHRLPIDCQGRTSECPATENVAGDAARGAIPPGGVALTIVYALFAVAFGYRMTARAPVD
jgi:hypothetical protein